MQPITILKDTPLNLLFVAINHYISTGDHIGEGIAAPEGPQKARSGEPHPDDKIRIMVLVNTTMRDDMNDWEKFKSRFNQVAKAHDTRLESHGKDRHFLVNSFVIRYGEVKKLTQALTEQPGPLGWGSMKPIIEKHFPG